MSETRDRAAGPNAATDGFTLIELMVVVVLISTVTLAAALRLPSLNRESAADFADTLDRALKFLGTESFFRSQSYGVAFDAQGWRVLDYVVEDRSWAVRDPDRLHASGRWAPAKHVAFWVEGREAVLEPRAGESEGSAQPDVFLLSSGEATPFVLRIADKTGTAFRCEMSALGDFSCEPDRA